jgi:predicted cupin superfamily sugar epimerase
VLPAHRVRGPGPLTSAPPGRAGRGDPDELIALLGLEPHPEGGHYRETWRDAGGRGTAIYFLLRAGEVSQWHRLDRPEVWHVYAGGTLELTTWTEGSGLVHRRLLGADLTAGERPQAVVGAGDWQTARPLADWVLAGCTVCPAFEFHGWELKPDGWEPPVER